MNKDLRQEIEKRIIDDKKVYKFYYDEFQKKLVDFIKKEDWDNVQACALMLKVTKKLK